MPLISCFKKLKPSLLGGWSRLKAWWTHTRLLDSRMDFRICLEAPCHSHPQPCSVTQLSSIQVLTPSGRTVCSHACVKVGLSSTDGANRCHCFWRLVLFFMFTWLFLLSLWWSALRDSSVRYGHVHCSHTKIYFYFVFQSNLNKVSPLIIIANTYPTC